MTLVKFINQMLGHLGVAAIRTETLNRLLDSQQVEQSLGELALARKEMQDATDRNYRQLLRHQISVKWDLVDLLERHRTPILPSVRLPRRGCQLWQICYGLYV